MLNLHCIWLILFKGFHNCIGIGDIYLKISFLHSFNNIYFSAAIFQKVNSDAVEKIRKISLCENLENDIEDDKEENDDDDVFDDL